MHICHGCCADKAAAIKTAQNLVFRLLHRRKIPIPKLSDWTHITASSQHVLMGRLLHGLWNLAEVFDISGANMEGVRARAEGPTDADLHDDGWIAQHGARVARTILASAEDDRFFAILVFLAATKEVSHLKAWFLKRTSGVNPKYKVDQTQNTTYVLLTPWLSPLFLALVSVCAPMKIRAAHEHFCWIWHFFPEVPAGEWCRRFFDMLVPLAGRLYWFMLLPLAQWPLSMFQMVNEFIGHDYRAWWVKAFSTEDECCLDQCSRKARRTHAGAASPGNKHRSLYSLFRGLHDCSLCAEWSIVDIETTHGRLRWLSGLGTQRTGTWTSTFGAYQTYFMGVRYHLEAATAALAETQGRLTARVRELRDQVAVFRKQLRLPGHWWFKKDNGLSGAESDRLWGNMSEAERGKWKDAAASARSMAKSKWQRARKELTAAEAECGISDTQSPRTPWGAGSSQHPLRAEVLAKDQLLEKCDVKGGGRPTVGRRLNAQKIQEMVPWVRRSDPPRQRLAGEGRRDLRQRELPSDAILSGEAAPRVPRHRLGQLVAWMAQLSQLVDVIFVQGAPRSAGAASHAGLSPFGWSQRGPLGVDASVVGLGSERSAFQGFSGEICAGPMGGQAAAWSAAIAAL